MLTGELLPIFLGAVGVALVGVRRTSAATHQGTLSRTASSMSVMLGPGVCDEKVADPRPRLYPFFGYERAPLPAPALAVIARFVLLGNLAAFLGVAFGEASG
jgi:hypothetical protein